MLKSKNEDFIAVETNYDGMFLVTIALKNGDIIYREPMYSKNGQLLLEGFSLHKHSVTFSPITNDNNSKYITL